MRHRRTIPDSVFLVTPPSDERGVFAALPSAALRGRFSYSGFTLLELLLVLFIMGLLATTATVMVDGLDTQSRYDESKRRMQMVKRAIAGDPQRIINNQPDVSGFVADMGRTPSSLQELLLQGTLPDYEEDTVSGLSAGWRGPYLETLGTGKFHDGYGNPGTASDNFGWTYTVAASGVVSLSSKGADTLDSADDIAAAELLVADDYEAAFSTVKINIHNRLATASAAANLKLRLYYPVDGEIASEDSAAFALPALSAVQSTQVTAIFSSPPSLPIGTRAFVVVCADGDADNDNDNLYDGDCAGPVPAAQHAVHFILAPRAQPAVLDWILQ
jgi:prepilin-type N-terminal cleavage/methylation domain-containing protein